jgi:hypothetical protein
VRSASVVVAPEESWVDAARSRMVARPGDPLILA